jgi:hypothetical protein
LKPAEERGGGEPAADAVVSGLARLFLTHPAWVRAAEKLEPRATSNVYFTHRPGEPWHLERRAGKTRLLPGPASDPDFTFRFTPAAVARLAGVDGDVGSFAVELFRLITESDPELRVDLRVLAPFARLVRRGYLGLLAAGGARVLAFGAARGVRSLAELRKLVEALLRRGPEPWESQEPPAP